MRIDASYPGVLKNMSYVIGLWDNCSVRIKVTLTSVPFNAWVHDGNKKAALPEVCTSDHDKGRYTVVLSAMANDRKLKPSIMFKAVTPVVELPNISGVIVSFIKNSQMNEALIVDWVK